VGTAEKVSNVRGQQVVVKEKVKVNGRTQVVEYIAHNECNVNYEIKTESLASK